MAKETQAAPEQPAEVAPQAPAKKSMMKNILIFGVPLFILQIVVIYFLMVKLVYPATANHATETPAQEEVAKVEAEEEQIFVVKDLIVNPAGTNGTRFLLTTVGFEIGTQEARQELEKKEVQVRDLLNTILASRGLDQLIDSRQKESLRQEISEKTGAMLKSGKLKNVYFSKYIIQ
jgi:flagellar FliL protein